MIRAKRAETRSMGANETVAVLVVAACLVTGGHATAAPAALPQSQVDRLLADADNAEKSGNLNLALIQLKNAAVLQPDNGEVRARLGLALLHSGQAANAERELRQAYKDFGPPELVVPGILSAMLQRKEYDALLMEYPDPPKGTEDKTTPDVLAARAVALQTLGKTRDARDEMDRGLSLRRDGKGLVASAGLALQQGDAQLAANQVDEAVKLSPANEAAWSMKVSLAGQKGDLKQALAAADEFLRQNPRSIAAKVTRVEVLLSLKRDSDAKQVIDAILKDQPKLLVAQYFQAVLMMRASNYTDAWHVAQALPPAFVQSRSAFARTVARIAVASGNTESAGAILTELVSRQPDDQAARVQLATLRLTQKDPKQALTVLGPITKSPDPSVQAVLAQAYLGVGRFDEAIAALELAKSSPGANPVLAQELAALELREGNSDRAIDELRDAVKRAPDNVQLSGALIGALMSGAKWDEALNVDAEVARRLPDSPWPAFYRGQILAARGNLADAATEYGKSLAHDPKFLPALYFRANTAAAVGNFEPAKKDLQLIIAQQPANWLAWSRLILIAIQTGEQKEARTLYDQAIKAAPRDTVPRLALAGYLVGQKDLPGAQAAVNAVLEMAPDNPQAFMLQGQIELLRGQTAEAVRTFRNLTAGKTPSPAAYDLLARALFATKDMGAAEDAAQKAVELDPASAEARRVLVELRLATDKPDAALAAAQAYAKSTSGPDADLLLADTLLRLKRTADAQAQLERSLAARPDPRLAIRLTQIAIQSGNNAKAKTIINDWLKTHPNDVEGRNFDAGWLMASGDTAGARAAYESLLAMRPNDPVALNNLASLLQKQDPVRALALATTAARIAPASAPIADTLGWTKHLRGDQQGALPLLQHAHELQSEDPAISYHLAVVLRDSGKQAEAKTLLQTTLAKNPKFDGVEEAKKVLATW